VLDAIAPSLAVVTTGRKGRADLPSQETVDLLAGIPTFRTDLHGTVEIKTDGHRLWVNPERGALEGRGEAESLKRPSAP
jgi:beta-lactamase superfamily II metal-dependent hydrolase